MTKKIDRELKREFPFAVIERTSGGHIRICLPNGKSVIASSTPSCPFYLKRVRGDVHRQLERVTCT